MAKISNGGRALSKNEKVLLGALCAAAVFFIVNMLVIEPNNQKIKPLKEEVEQLKAQVANISNIDSSIKMKEKELEGLKVEFDKATESIPKTDRYPEVVKDLEEMAAKSNITIASYSLSLPTVVSGQQSDTGESEQTNNASGLHSFNIQIKVNGVYTDVLTFINNIEGDSRIKEVVTLNSNNENSDINILYYVAGGINTEEYDFNEGSFGKSNPFN